jgi:GT2 family glycosyltransferase
VKGPKIIIILLNWNGKKDTLECLNSLAKVNYPNRQAIVVDNGSTDGSIEEIRSVYPMTPILENGENLGFAGGNNPGIEWALRHKAEWILLLNNDTTVAPDFLDAFLQAAHEKSKAKVLGAKILRYHEPNVVDHLGGMWNETKGEFDSQHCGETDHPYFNMQPVDYVCGAALFMHRSVPEKIGLLEPNFFLFWEETDFCYRAKRAGFEVWTAPEAKVWHKVSSSFTGGKPHMHYFWWRSRLLWIERNCSEKEKTNLYKRVIIPELWKMGRHYLLKTIFSSDKNKKEKLKRYKAGCAGAIDFFRKRFGNCPSWLVKK